MKTIYQSRPGFALLVGICFAVAMSAQAGNVGEKVVPLVSDAGEVTLELREANWSEACIIAGQINHATDGPKDFAARPEAEAVNARQVVVRLPRELWNDVEGQIAHIMALAMPEMAAAPEAPRRSLWAHARGSGYGWEIDSWASAFAPVTEPGAEGRDAVISAAYSVEDIDSRGEFIGMQW